MSRSRPAVLLLALAVAAIGTIALFPVSAGASGDSAVQVASLGEAERARPGIARTCRLIAASARSNRLPPEYLARLLWMESRFDPRAVSPKGALGIAQFMPGTARLRGLRDPFDPGMAIPASAAYLAKLRRQFGNLGLAAAAYNGGEARVARWLESGGRLPRETRDYVHGITGRPANWFRVRGREVERRALAPRMAFDEACRAMPRNASTVLLHAPKPMPWSVQVAGHRRKSTAAAQFARMDPRLREIIDDEGRPLLRVRSGAETASFWSVEVALETRNRAVSLCGKLRANGGRCVVWGQ